MRNTTEQKNSPSVTEGTTELTATEAISILPESEPSTEEQTSETPAFPKGEIVLDFLLADIEQKRARKLLEETLQPGVPLRNKMYSVDWERRPAFKVFDPAAVPPRVHDAESRS